jgi:uncharacterized membrane protein
MSSLAIFLKNVSSQDELQWRTCIQIEVFEDCSASWIIQRKAILKTDADKNLFFQYLSETSFDMLLDNVRSMVNRASLITGRIMKVENFEGYWNISNVAFEEEGVLQYQFNWLGFAERIDDERIKVGDALSGEFDLLADDVLTIIYPNGYSPVLANPSPDKIEYDKGALTWLGYINFGMGEPTIIFQKESYSWAQTIKDNAVTILSASVITVLVGMLGYLFGRKRFYEREKLKPRLEEEKPAFLSIENDEEKVIRLLAAAGGRLHQSTITKQCGFSKSKTSGLLSAMERKGVISRKKSGRGKIVTLIEKTSVDNR